VTRLPPDFAQQYAAALAGHLGDLGELALHQAYELGRRALSDGLGVLDIAMLHHEALDAAAAQGIAPGDPAAMAKAAAFLAECLSPFEMTLRGYQETNLRLTALNATLAEANAAAAAANQQLRAEIAERERVEEAFRQAQKLQAVGKLAGGVAHDFNNLLTVLLGNLEFALQHAAADPVLSGILTKVQRAAERGATVTSQLLAFSRQQLLHPEIIEAPERLNNLAALLGGSLRGNITIETDIPVELWAVKVDPAQLELALINLGLNARDAMPAGGVVLITAANRSVRDERLDLDGDYLVIAFSDTGSGIAADVLPRVFEPYFTTKDVGEGSGLGLSQVHGFAHQSGGAIAIESELGKGTTVTLYLPAAHRPRVVAASAPAEPAARASGRPAIVLVVEDDIDVAAVAAELLRQWGFDVRLAYRAHAALDLLRKGERVDLIFTDVVMPDGMSGIELAEEVRRRFPDIPVLLATGYTAAALSAASSGLPIIAKPYRHDELRQRVDALLSARPH
jgi:signal transduction histidine kinase/CheY-like chemotaxis protein